MKNTNKVLEMKVQYRKYILIYAISNRWQHYNIAGEEIYSTTFRQQMAALNLSSGIYIFFLLYSPI